MPHSLQLHFQEGFTGQTVIVSLDAQIRAELEPRTRLQLGLADILTLDVENGQTLTVSVPAWSVEKHHPIAPSDRILAVNIADRDLILTPLSGPLGYF